MIAQGVYLREALEDLLKGYAQAEWVITGGELCANLRGDNQAHSCNAGHWDACWTTIVPTMRGWIEQV